MKLQKVTKETFSAEVLNAGKSVLADFNADWCGPCQALKPILERLADAHGEYKFVSINIDDEPDLAEEYGVASIPCLVIFKNGAEAARSIGLKSGEDLDDFLGAN